MKVNYRTSEIAKISGVSARTLRYYDEIDLLKPNKVDDNGYRIYTDNEVDKLQMILLYREMGMPLEEIRALISSDDFDKEKALESHLITLFEKKTLLEKMIYNVTQTIKSQKEGTQMSNSEKFIGLEIIAENESKYGEELRAKYGEELINKSFEKVRKGNYEDLQYVSDLANQSLITAFKTNDPASKEAFTACENHKNLLLMTWADDTYTIERHMALVEGFTADERFTNYYENLEKGLMGFFYKAMQVYCKQAKK